MRRAAKFHRNARPIPTDPAERKALVLWCHDHLVWTHPDKYEGEDFDNGSLHECVEFDFVYVDPTTERIEGDDVPGCSDPRNTAFRVWVEAGGWTDLTSEYGGYVSPDERWQRHHDLRLDCGGPDMETALLELAVRVAFYYGDGRDDLPGTPERCVLEYVPGVPSYAPVSEQYRDTCVADGEGYCTACGYAVRSGS